MIRVVLARAKASPKSVRQTLAWPGSWRWIYAGQDLRLLTRWGRACRGEPL